MLSLLLAALLMTTPPITPPTPLTWQQLQALPAPTAAPVLAYGSLPQQTGEWRFRPKAPALLLLHGGCWLNAYDAAYLRPLAAALYEQGWSVYLPEYRRLGDEGGGWPGTFHDVQAAYQTLLKQPDIGAIAVAGHSAGGQLALWLGADQGLPALGLAAITNLESYRSDTGCGASVEQLLGRLEAFSDRYKQVSPHHRLPVKAALLQGEQDPIVPLAGVQTFAQAAHAPVTVLAGLGHFDVVAPTVAVLDFFKAHLPK
jgi:pimeloyl-ACP methyl ester carboxylesterase